MKELRALVNVIKHAEGDSEQKLRKMRLDYFEHDMGIKKYDLLSLHHSTATLQIKDKDFSDYFNALVAFWNELSEQMYTIEEVR